MASQQGLTESEELLLRAEDGEKLQVDDRRKAIAYLMGAKPDVGVMDMSRLFQVSEGMIRKDRDFIRKQISDDITKDDVGLVIGDIRRTFDRVIVEIEKSAQESKKGTAVYLAHKKAVLDYELKKVEALQSLGYYPKNLGTQTQTRFVFKSHVVEKTGAVNTLPVPEEDIPTIEGELVNPNRLLPAVTLTPVQQAEQDEAERIRAALEAEFKETPTAPNQNHEGSE
jgi:hypothetical protein